MTPIVRSVASAAFGAAAMFWLDPTRGRRRRAMFKEKMGSAAGDFADAVETGGRDLGHRARGVGHGLRSWFTRAPVSDEVLTDRVRSALGRAVSHPKAVSVMATNGRVTLHGAVLAYEHPHLLDTVCSVRGVQEVSDELAVHENARGVPELQGGKQRGRVTRLAMLGRSTPAGRLIAGASGGTLLLFGLSQLFGPREHRPLATGAVALGTLLVARSIISHPVRRVMEQADTFRSPEMAPRARATSQSERSTLTH